MEEGPDGSQDSARLVELLLLMMMMMMWSL
jgi:hypothetical protein